MRISVRKRLASSGYPAVGRIPGTRACQNRFMFFFFKQKTAYEISACDWSSDVCSSDLRSSDLKQKTAYGFLNVTGVQTCALPIRSEEHTSELQSHSEISYAVSLERKSTRLK